MLVNAIKQSHYSAREKHDQIQQAKQLIKTKLKTRGLVQSDKDHLENLIKELEEYRLELVKELSGVK